MISPTRSDFGGKGKSPEDTVYNPHHQKHKQKDGYDDQKSSGTAKECDGNCRNN